MRRWETGRKRENGRCRGAGIKADGHQRRRGDERGECNTEAVSCSGETVERRKDRDSKEGSEEEVGEEEGTVHCTTNPCSSASGVGMTYPTGLSIAVEYLEASDGCILATLNLSSMTSCGKDKAAIKFCIAFSFPTLPPEDEESCGVCEMKLGCGIVITTSPLLNGSDDKDIIDGFLEALGRRE